MEAIKKFSQQRLKPVFMAILCVLFIGVSSYQKPIKVQAAATGVVVGGAIIVATIAAAMGIGVSAAVDQVSYSDKCTQIWNSAKSNFEGNAANAGKSFATQFNVTSTAINTAGNWICHASREMITYIMQAYSSMYPPIGTTMAASSVEDAANANRISTELGLSAATGWNDFTWTLMKSMQYEPNGWVKVATGVTPVLASMGQQDTITQNIAGLTMTYTDTLKNLYNRWPGRDLTVAWSGNTIVGQCSTYSPFSCVPNANDTAAYDGGGYGVPFVVWQSVDANNENYLAIFFAYVWQSAIYGTSCYVSKSLVGTMNQVIPADDNLYADGYSTMLHPVDQVIDKAAEAQGTTDGIDVAVPGTATGTAASVGADTLSQTQTQVLGKDIATSADIADDATTNIGRSTIRPLSPAVPDFKVPTAITKKFPFSIPWDIARAITVLSAQGEAPSWPVEIKNDILKWDFKTTIDLSGFNGIAALMRWGLSLLFLLGLIKLTKGLIRN